MRPETEEERQEREALERSCEHELTEIRMPHDWERMSGSASCTKCSYSVLVSIVRVKE